MLIVVGIFLTGIPVITFCSFYCSSGDVDSTLGGSCTFSFHSFVQSAIGLSALFVLPVAGLFIAGERPFIPTGIYLPLFKPPRIS